MNGIREQRVLQLLSEDPAMILLFKDKYATENMWKVAIENEPSLFQYIKDPTESMIMYALQEDGANIQYLKKMGIIPTPEMVYAAIDSYPGAVYMLPIAMQTNRVKEYACSKDPSLMRDLVMTKSFIRNQLKKDPAIVRYLNHPTEDQICDALLANPNTVVYVKEFTPKIRELIMNNYPELIPLIPSLSESQT